MRLPPKRSHDARCAVERLGAIAAVVADAGRLGYWRGARGDARGVSACRHCWWSIGVEALDVGGLFCGFSIEFVSGASHLRERED